MCVDVLLYLPISFPYSLNLLARVPSAPPLALSFPFTSPRAVTFYRTLRFFFISCRTVRPNRIRCYFFTCAVSVFSSSRHRGRSSLMVNDHRKVAPSSPGHLFTLEHIMPKYTRERRVDKDSCGRRKRERRDADEQSL